ncbi:MAG: ATP-grasp domain-containing protein [Candidatus Omnitrophota bacterium]
MKEKNKLNTLGIIYNLKTHAGINDSSEEYDDPETIESLASEIQRYGYRVLRFQHDNDLTKKLLSEQPDFILNIAEGKGNTRARESQVPCILESLRIPYSGSDPVILGITLDKYLTNLVLKSAGIPVPQAYSISSEKDLNLLPDIFEEYNRFIIKPRWDGSSKGIFSDSLVSDRARLEKQVRHILETCGQPAIIEEFLENDEITVGVLGNKEPKIIGMMRISPSLKTEKPFIYCVDNKRTWRETVKYEPDTVLPRETKLLVENYALKAFHALELRDISRIDFRLGKDNIPRIIDVNPLPGLSPDYSDLPIMYRLSGKSYSSLIRAILYTSFERHSLNTESLEHLP